MPYLSLPTRRGFLSAMGGVTILGAQTASTRWALLSDTHVSEDVVRRVREFSIWDNMKRVVEQIARAAPEGAIIDGDLAALTGLPGDYHNLKRALGPLTSEMPVGMALGNHDHLENFLSQFSDHPGEVQPIKNKHVLVLESGPVRFIVLDSLLRTDLVCGLLGKAQRTWIDEYLGSASPKPTMLFVHHTLDDRDSSLLDVERMFRIVRPHKMVKAIFYGHSHAYSFEEQDGIHLVNIPAVGYNFVDREPVGWVEAVFTPEGGNFTLHAIAGNTSTDGKTTTLNWRA